MTDFLARREHLALVGSTNDVVRGWLADGTPEVCLGVADEQSDGRGRDGRRWLAPPRSALLLSLGFRPTWLEPEQTWRLAATASLAMADAGEEVAGLADRAIGLKWPNDLVTADGPVRKLGGVLGETEGLGTRDPRVVVGIGLNGDWAAEDFPPDLATSMTSLRVASGGRPIDRVALLDAFLDRLEVRIEALRGGRFDVADWIDRQSTTGHDVELTTPDGSTTIVRALGVDARSGALVVADEASPDGERQVLVGDIRHARLATAGIGV
jgi:BirA family transcriptional regulator, biotin operon repressor / biotin---[acetyl-CoA-carboxylase] ligase